MLDPQTIEAELKELAPRMACMAAQQGNPRAEDWQRIMPTVSPRQLYTQMSKALGIAKPHMLITFSNNGSAEIELVFSDITNHITVDKQGVYLQDIILPRGAQNQGKAGKLAQLLAQLARGCEHNVIELSAAHEAGAYTWARMGFAPVVDRAPNLATSDDTDWSGLKCQLKNFRLNQEGTRIEFNTLKNQATLVHSRKSPFAKSFAGGFDLLPNETKVISAALASPEPQDIWRISDLGRTLATIPQGKNKPPFELTVGKALLCGLSWGGRLELTPKSKAYERFLAYVNRTPDTPETGTQL